MPAIEKSLLSRSDTLSFFPFEQANGALTVSITPTPHDQPIAQGKAIPFQKHFWERGVQPSFEMRIDHSKATEAQIEERDLSVAAFIRNPTAKRYDILARWNVKEVPRSWVSEKPIRISSRTEIGVILFLNRGRKAKPGTAYRVGSILETASVSIVPEQPRVVFPVREMPPSEFVKLNLPPETLHAVHFKTGDSDRPAADVVEVLVNQKHVDRLTAAMARPGGRSLASSIGASIYAAIARGALENARLPARDSEGLLAKIRHKIATVHDIDDNELLLSAKEPQNPLIDAVAQILVSLHKNL